MGDVRLHVAGRTYDVSCADGDEAHLESLAAIVDEKAHQARMVVGDINEARQLLFAAIFLADELQNTQRDASAPPSRPDITPQIKALTDQIHHLVEKVSSAN